MGKRQDAVLRVLANADRPLAGMQVSAIASLRSGTIHPALAEFERCGWVTSWWEETGEDDARLRRRLYRITPDGRQAAGEILSGQDHWWRHGR
jgi:DNA-binding PadR family transcriptional regulator